MEGLDHNVEHRVAPLRGLEVELLRFVATEFSASDWQQWIGAAMEKAAIKGNATLFRGSLRAGAIDVLNWRRVEDMPLLASAVVGGNEDVVLAVLECGGKDDVDAKIGPTGRSALHLAADRGYEEACSVLITAGGADINIQDNSHKTPLLLAAMSGHTEVVVELLRRGARVDHADLDGNQPLHDAAKHGDVPMVSALLSMSCGGDAARIVNAHDMRGRTPLYWAAGCGHVDVAKHLLANGADINQRVAHSDTVLHAAALTGRLDMLRALLARGADVTAVNEDGWNALHNAAWYDAHIADGFDHADILRTLINAGADVDSRDTGMWTPLHYLCNGQVSRLDCVQFLLRAGADVNAAAVDGKTPLHRACAHVKEEAVAVLLACGADLTAVDQYGTTPVQAVGSLAAPGDHDAATLADKIARVTNMLGRAPADRAWCRRGWLVMCRDRAIAAPRGLNATATGGSVEGLVSTPPSLGYGCTKRRRIMRNESASVGMGVLVGGGDDGGNESSAEAPDPFEKLATAVFTVNEGGSVSDDRELPVRRYGGFYSI